MRLAVCGGKGGGGKTTTSLSLAGALVETRREPIVVDCDRDMPNLHVYAGTQDKPGVDDIADGISIAGAVHDVTTPAGVRVVPGQPGSDVSGALDRLGGDKSADSLVHSSTDSLVLDTPAGASEDVAVPLRFADGAVIVTTPSAPWVRGAMKTATMACALDAPVVGVVVSRTTEIPGGLPEAFGVPRDCVVAVPPAENPLSSAVWRPIRRLCGVLVPNA